MPVAVLGMMGKWAGPKLRVGRHHAGSGKYAHIDKGREGACVLTGREKVRVGRVEQSECVAWRSGRGQTRGTEQRGGWMHAQSTNAHTRAQSRAHACMEGEAKRCSVGLCALKGQGDRLL